MKLHASGEILCGPETKICRIRAVVRHYPMDETLCTFRSDRKTVNQIFELCRNGVKYGTQEGIWTALREKRDSIWEMRS